MRSAIFGRRYSLKDEILLQMNDTISFKGRYIQYIDGANRKNKRQRNEKQKYAEENEVFLCTFAMAEATYSLTDNCFI